jgi:hypothetical protein
LLTVERFKVKNNIAEINVQYFKDQNSSDEGILLSSYFLVVYNITIYKQFLVHKNVWRYYELVFGLFVTTVVVKWY